MFNGSRAGVAGLDKRITPHILRLTFATELRRRRYEVEQIQKLPGHMQRETTMRYLQGIEIDVLQIVSPLDG